MSYSNDNQFEKKNNDAEVLLILNEIQAMQETAATTPESDDQAVEEAMSFVQLTPQGVKTFDEEEAEKPASPQPPAPRRGDKKPNPFVRVFRYLIPQRGDGGVEMLRKTFFMLALMTIISSAVYLIHDTVWIPSQNQGMNEKLEGFVIGIENATEEEHREKMDELYKLNKDFRAWFTYKAGGEDFLNISYPVVYSGDNDFYLEHDFYKNYNKNGTLFFDERNVYTLDSAKNKVSIIYGHNMISGQMFAHLNSFLNGVSYAKAAPAMQLDTFFGREEYKVFAVALIDADASAATSFNYLRTSFSNDLDFLYYINEIRARSLYDYDSVTVNEDDELLVLSTCTNESQVYLEDGRLAVFARKVRVGEKPTVDVNQITYNSDVIMPYAWYANQELTPHGYYGGYYEIPSVTTTTTGHTNTNESTTTTSQSLEFESVVTTTTKPVEVVIGSANIIRPTTTTGAKTTAGKTTGGTAAKSTTTAAPTTTTAKVTKATTTTTAAPTATEAAATEADVADANE